MELLKRLEEHRLLEKRLAWEGTFADYLKIVKAKPPRSPACSRPYLPDD